MGPKEPRRKSVRTLPDRWSRYFFIATWMLLFWSGQVQAGEIRGVQTLAPLVGKLLQSVVGIKATMMEAPLASPPTDTAPGLPGGPSPRASDVFGAGVIIGAEAGLIVTSRHVVSGAKTLSVQLSDGRQLDAEFVVSDERYDLAMLRISASGLTAASIGRSIEAKPGDFVLAVGGSSGSTPSVSFGIVSALHRSRPGIPCQDLIQIDALLHRGSSGGALFNLRGEVIGIVVAGTDEFEAERAFGFAIPSDAIDRLYIRMN